MIFSLLSTECSCCFGPALLFSKCTAMPVTYYSCLTFVSLQAMDFEVEYPSHI